MPKLFSMNFLNDINHTFVKNLITVVAVVSIVIGFFIGKVSPEIFYATIGGIISHFYQETTIKKMSKKMKAQSEEIKILKHE